MPPMLIRSLLATRLPVRTWFHSLVLVDPANADDVDALLPLMRGYCDFYEVSPADEGLEEMARALIATDEPEGMLLVARAEEGGPPVGFAAVGWKWSSLRGARVAILEDLFVHPDARRSGAGRALISSCADRARSHGAPCMLWVTAHDNTQAQSLYDSLGAEAESWLEYELELE
jgi:ribosomal protein S18 acetylase RimI-like enzyme